MTVAAEVTSSAPKAFRPGAFALRDAWFPLVHSVRVGKRPVRRIVHGQPVVFWCDHDGLHATEDLPGTRREHAGPASSPAEVATTRSSSATAISLRCMRK